jgi:magnesium-transporting ATPase (P-type)
MKMNLKKTACKITKTNRQYFLIAKRIRKYRTRNWYYYRILFVYQWTVQNGGNEQLTRTMVFTTLVFSNVILSLVNRSFYYSVFASLKNKNNMMVIAIC